MLRYSFWEREIEENWEIRAYTHTGVDGVMIISFPSRWAAGISKSLCGGWRGKDSGTRGREPKKMDGVIGHIGMAGSQGSGGAQSESLPRRKQFRFTTTNTRTNTTYCSYTTTEGKYMTSHVVAHREVPAQT